MRSSSQGGPEWIYKKKIEGEPSTQLDQTLTKPFYDSKSGYRSFSQFTAQHDHLNPDISVSKRIIESANKDKDKISQFLKHNHFISRIPIEHNCRQLLAEFKQGQIHQEIELLNREHERLRRLLTQRYYN